MWSRGEEGLHSEPPESQEILSQVPSQLLGGKPAGMWHPHQAVALGECLVAAQDEKPGKVMTQVPTPSKPLNVR